MASQPPSSVIAACRTVTAIPLAAQSRRAALTRRWTVSTSGAPSMSATLRWPNPATCSTKSRTAPGSSMTTSCP